MQIANLFYIGLLLTLSGRYFWNTALRDSEKTHSPKNLAKAQRRREGFLSQFSRAFSLRLCAFARNMRQRDNVFFPGP
ncbi:MAG: hypothetical protein B6245_11875 [Desulfobacteraceae bacterium 4572_88]|nr:MAG: hypothetical protein B6245_11875 [Desulfobacteraceae bacterium 4572_88]